MAEYSPSERSCRVNMGHCMSTDGPGSSVGIATELRAGRSGIEPVLMAARLKARVCGPSLAGIVGSELAGGVDVRLLWSLCVVR